ncbi:helix-turn-helix transcriptional regulator [Pectobacterium brasiliense]|nr:TetR/AcrR family transcriptional regulator [Pectobacterium brasiliense]MBN3341994.1 helix-turn-helix transcriptional regulator [Pectobacterium brasiliense]
MRADARKNYGSLLAAARAAVELDGADASLRDIARKAGVGLGTLYRHFPTRESLLETLLQDTWQGLTLKGQSLEESDDPDDALVSWLRDFVEAIRMYRGLVNALASAFADENSALHASCVAMKATGTALLSRAQTKGTVRADIEGADLFALAGALAWIGEQPSINSRASHMFDVMVNAIFKP